MLSTLIEQLEILRRIGERGLKLSQDIAFNTQSFCEAKSNDTVSIDCWQHMLDEIERTQIIIQSDS